MSEDKRVLQILDVGCGKDPIAPTVFEDIINQGYEYELTTIDIDPENNPTYVLDLRGEMPPELIGKFDLILASHVFEHIERHVALKAFRNMASMLKYMGELWVVVPSLEWCADQIKKNKMTAAVWLCLYGGGEPNRPSYWYHNMGYTIATLRDVFSMGGLVVRKAYQMPLRLPFKQEGSEEIREYMALQNIVVGVQPNEPVAIVGD